MLKYLSAFFVFCLFHSKTTYCQPSKYSIFSSADSTEIYAAVKNKLPRNSQARFYTYTLDTANQHITAIFTYISHTTKGDCAKTNGCTLSSTYTFVLNSKKRLISKTKTKAKYHNYE